MSLALYPSVSISLFLSLILCFLAPSALSVTLSCSATASVSASVFVPLSFALKPPQLQLYQNERYSAWSFCLGSPSPFLVPPSGILAFHLVGRTVGYLLLLSACCCVSVYFPSFRLPTVLVSVSVRFCVFLVSVSVSLSVFLCLFLCLCFCLCFCVTVLPAVSHCCASLCVCVLSLSMCLCRRRTSSSLFSTSSPRTRLARSRCSWARLICRRLA